MSKHSPIFNLALGALWTAGHRPSFREKLDLQNACPSIRDNRTYEELRKNGGRSVAIEALAACGYAIANNPDGMDLVEPLPRLPRPLIPTAGDGIRCLPSWAGCQRVHLQGIIGEYRRGFTIANAAGGWHCGTNPDRRAVISMGCGGPSSISYLDTRHLRTTGETVRLRVWDFAYSPEAHTAVDWMLTVPLWDWKSPEDSYWADSHFIGSQEAARDPWHWHARRAAKAAA